MSASNVSASGVPASSLVTLATGDGAKARVHLEGGHVTSWSPAGIDDDLLFVSSKSGFGPGVSIRGGIPVCFPQFGGEGTLPAHGFARTSTWTLIAASDGERASLARLRLVDDDRTRELWPHAFAVDLVVTISGRVLDVAVAVANTGDAPFAFTGALHTYFRVDDAYRCRVKGLQGTRYRDALRARGMFDETADALAIDGEIDRVYFDVPGPVSLVDGARALRVEQRGFRDVVVWNPGEAGVARREDFHTGDERKMVCVESAAVGRPVTVAPGEVWEGGQRVSAQ